MLMRWETLGSADANAADGQSVSVSGFPVALPGQNRAVRFLLTR